ncbi:MAG TPA: hypothetical protein VGS41_01005 [Chthonomonadales bacterium]|nr:hypothetical protein [Chthonomonadales bacterium]
MATTQQMWQIVPRMADNPRPGDAVFDRVNFEDVYKLEAGVDMAIAGTFVMPDRYSGATGLTVNVHWFCQDSVAGNVVLEAAFETDHTGSDPAQSDAWGTPTVATAQAVPPTAGQIFKQPIAVAKANFGNRAPAVGDRVRVRVRRLGKSNTGDTCAANIFVTNVEIMET